MIEIAGLIVGLSIIILIFYFISLFAHKISNSSLDFLSFVGLPLGATVTWLVIAGFLLAFMYSKASEEDRRSLITFAAFVPVVGFAVYLISLNIGAVFFSGFTSFWERFAVSSAIMAALLGVTIAWYFLAAR